ncbi:MAG TPA: hypothetical protein VER36_05955 [Flavisolibacter sp.]|nr:hypothetical protein [Flavisolibacter sp.]
MPKHHGCLSAMAFIALSIPTDGQRIARLFMPLAKVLWGRFNFRARSCRIVNSVTSHGSVVEFKGKWYLLYHNKALSKNNFRRSVCFDEIRFAEDGKINRLQPQN